MGKERGNARRAGESRKKKETQGTIEAIGVAVSTGGGGACEGSGRTIGRCFRRDAERGTQGDGRLPSCVLFFVTADVAAAAAAVCHSEFKIC